MFIKKMATNIFVYYWSDGLEGNAFDLNIIIEMGAGNLPTKTARWAGHLTNVFQMPGVYLGEGCSRLDLYTGGHQSYGMCCVCLMSPRAIVIILTQSCFTGLVQLFIDMERIPLWGNYFHKRVSR